MITSSDNPWVSRIEDDDISEIAQKLISSSYFKEDEQWLLIYNTQLYRERLRYLKQHFPSDTLHTLAIKSCPLISILKIAV